MRRLLLLSNTEFDMFRLIRLPFLLGIAFVIGVFYERNAGLEKCLDAGGDMQRGICRGVAK